MNYADQLRDLATLVETVESGPEHLIDAELAERHDGQLVADIELQVPLPLAEHVPDSTDDVDAGEVEGEGDEPVPVTELADVASGLGESTISRLEEAGYEAVADVEAASREDLEALPRVGPKKVEELIGAVDELVTEAPPTEDPAPPPWTPDNSTGGLIAPTRMGQDGGQKP